LLSENHLTFSITDGF